MQGGSFREKKKDGMNILRCEGHEIYGMRVNKVSLSFDTKRCIADDGMGTLVLGARLVEAGEAVHLEHNQQFFANRLVQFKTVYFRRPNWVCGCLTPPL